MVSRDTVTADISPPALRAVVGDERGEAQVLDSMFEWVFRDSLDAILLTAPDGRIFRANPAATKLFGWSEQELREGGRALLVDTSDPRLEPALKERAEKGRCRTELTFRERSGELFPGEVSTAIFQTQDGARTAMVIRDLRPQKDLESRLARERERFRFLSEASATMARSLDYESTLLAVARSALPEFADYCIVDLLDEHGEFHRAVAAAADPEKEAVLREIAPRYGPRVGSSHPAAIAVANQSAVLLSTIPETLFEDLMPDADARRSVRARVPSGSTIAVPLCMRDRCFGALLVSAVVPGRFGPEDVPLVEDLARRASQFLDNARLYKEAQRAIASRDEVLAVVAHDLRNPLSAIAVRGQSLLRSDLRSPLRERVEANLHDVRRMDVLIQDLLDVVRSEGGVLRLQRVPEAPAQIMADAQEMMQPLADLAGVLLSVDVEPGLRPVSVEKKRILQVLSNLAGNALKFTQPGTTVRLEARGHEGEVRFCVADQGPGIPPEQLEHVFDRFWQGSRAKGRGLGLGLSIARALVESHGGRVWAESVLGQGTRMYFTLPLADP